MSAPDRFEMKVKFDPVTGCHVWNGSISTQGYGRFAWAGKARQAHRMAWIFYNGEIPDGLCILHRCDNRRCVNPDHLFLGTYLDNVRDMLAKGRHVHFVGEATPSAKLTREAVAEIRASREPHVIVAAAYGVTPETVSHVRRHLTWRYV